ncbi:MAG: flagellar biosynthesis protein FlgK [Lachnospiraceae bacterium]|nr:flagellar biosynthesis protein FlgK [Lachnospiraceae bacterium]
MLRATFAGFSTAISAMQASQKRLDITGQNLSNMNTVGYTRQTLETSSLNYTNPVSKYMSANDLTVGFGVSMDRISQVRDPYLDAQYRTQMTKASYSDAIQVSLDSLADVLDESTINGISKAFNDIQATLVNMQDGSKGVDPVYESELRSRMQALTNLLNEAAEHIARAEQSEFERLDGTGYSENGAEQEVNDILRQIGDLNVQIKRNQILGQPSLELMDERNLLLDTLSSYIPIEVSYFKDSEHQPYTDANGNLVDPLDERDHNGTVIGRKEWPDDLKVEMVYTDANGDVKRFTLVNGSEGGRGNNYGELEFTNNNTFPITADNYGKNAGSDIFAHFTFPSSNATDPSITATSVDIYAGKRDDQINNGGKSYLSSGSIQASLDMLERTGDGTINGKHGYEYYNNQLDTLAKSFADVMNAINNQGNGGPGSNAELLGDGNGGFTNITAANISINPQWVSGDVHIGTQGESFNETILNMLEAMKTTYPVSGSSSIAGIVGSLSTPLGNKTFSNFMSHVSTTLANDSLNNTTEMKNQVTVLNGLQNSRDAVSGVSLDEEGSNMMVYLSAYNAAARLMTALDEALNTLINNTGLVGR